MIQKENLGRKQRSKFQDLQVRQNVDKGKIDFEILSNLNTLFTSEKMISKVKTHPRSERKCLISLSLIIGL